MKTWLQLVIIFFVFLWSFFFYRSFLYGVKTYQLNNSALKKREKGQNFKEWLLYSRYKEEIPKILLVFYYFILIIHLMGIISCIILRFTENYLIIGRIIVISFVSFDGSWMLINKILFWSGKRELAYDRWINKRKGQKRYKKRR